LLSRHGVITAPTNSSTAPVAASGTRIGAMPSAAGAIRPAAQDEVAKVLSLVEAGALTGDYEWTVWETSAAE